MIRLDEDHPGATVHRNAFQMFDQAGENAGSRHGAVAQTSSAPSPPSALRIHIETPVIEIYSSIVRHNLV